ncbi:hypothetical protein HLH44_19910 [Gluconacetobacter sp. 1c LMG 22058]|uniref:Uncharacterized protein n=1 Tax=Gluconacetobacter dulcium TaxID=2729096 RepID=A0A7W4K3N9_9PROT|nr:hypothetical protein [Gluconacetobacter dulcium]MBB2199665.1 hypothetical protein [Gluconacetobacter dulcium]
MTDNQTTGRQPLTDTDSFRLQAYREGAWAKRCRRPSEANLFDGDEAEAYRNAYDGPYVYEKMCLAMRREGRDVALLSYLDSYIGVGDLEMRILQEIRSTAGMSATISCHGQGTGRALDRLEEKGWINVVENRWHVTEAGREAADAYKHDVTRTKVSTTDV